MLFHFALPEHDRKLMPEGRLGAPMPWVIAIMVFLTVLASAAGLSLTEAGGRIDLALRSQATVQILQADPTRRAAEQEAAVAVLNAHPSVEAAVPVADKEIESLLAPWLGDNGAIGEDIPIPGVIDVELGAPADRALVTALRDRIARVAPSARIDANGAWLAPVRDTMRLLQWIAAALVLLLAVATAATVVLTARSALSSHRGTIAIVHLLGGTDVQISRLFQRRIALDALFGGMIGFIAGLLLLWLLAEQTGRIDTPITDAGGLSWWSWIMLGAIPLATALLAAAMARLTIVGALRKML